MSAIRLEVTARDGEARSGLVRTARGSYPVPAFMPVGTRGAVKTLDSADLDALDPPVVLANTFHLACRPGADVVAELGGIHRFTGFAGHVLTDSGGFQVHSLGPKVDDEGMTFTSVYDGSAMRLTPESAVDLQGVLGSDIQMVLDVCVSLPAGRDELRRAVDRTADWGARARRRHRQIERRPEGQAIFGIVQGGCDADLRAESAARAVEGEFDGYAVGGLSVGEPRPAMLDTLAATLPHLPSSVPRYLMGVGDPVGLIEAVALGVDQFDCVAPTRMARHGTVMTAAGRLNLRNAANQTAPGPLDDACPCPVCARYNRGYLRHLLLLGEPTAWRLLTLHNLTFVLGFMAEIRRAVGDGTLARLRERTAEVWA